MIESVQRKDGERRLNAAFFLTPKSDVAHLYADSTLRQGMEKMRSSGFSAIPVIRRDGVYVGTLREGDLLWHLIGEGYELTAHTLRDLESTRIETILKPGLFPAARITAPMTEIVHMAMQQNFVPIVDDDGRFIGIVTRMNVMKYLTQDRVKTDT